MRLALLSFALFLAACGGSPTSQVTTTPPTTVASGAPTCPMDVAGTSVTVEDAAAGGALVFVTTGDVAALRASVTAWADRHNAHHAQMGPLPTGDEAGGGGHHHHHHHGGGGGGSDGGDGAAAGAAGGSGSTEMPMTINAHSRAAVTEIDGGGRFEIVTFPASIGALQEELRAHAAHLSAGTCG